MVVLVTFPDDSSELVSRELCWRMGLELGMELSLVDYRSRHACSGKLCVAVYFLTTQSNAPGNRIGYGKASFTYSMVHL